MGNLVYSPKHYASNCASIEPIEVLQYASFPLGNALKYMIRAGDKQGETAHTAYLKAEYYLRRVMSNQLLVEDAERFFDCYGNMLILFPGMPFNISLKTLQECLKERLQADD